MQQTDGTTVVEDHTAAGPSGKRQRISIASTQDYDEISLLGAGGFGVVTKARHRTTGEAVAIKRHHHLLSNSGDDGDLLLREARMLDACRGVPFLVGYHGLARDRATNGELELCLLMEHVAGPSLRDYLRRRRRRRRQPPVLPEPMVRAAMWQLLTCTGAMHKRGVIHRDIKPANILVGGDRRTVKICDLGLAIRTSDPPPRARAGTLAYMAPEVLLGRTDCDARVVDAWSLGCVMAELVAGRGRPVFDGGGDEVGQLWAIYEVLDMPDGHEHDVLREMFPEEMLSREGFEVLSGLLAFDAENRLTADAALRMPWFDSVGALELPKEEEVVVVTAPAAVHKKKRLRLIVPPPLAKKPNKVF
ncbi:unnamed protein product [Urochloa decumbens]|uniref:[RNA-polymerase]-subunit kinase n=1 Tax=Urochloa decumbens TaxID=240449 RepID=A0ABC8VZM8_9POAL